MMGKFDIEYLTATAKSKIIVDEKTALMTKVDFDALLNYSTTLPTGTFIGKRWKRNLPKQDETKWIFSDKWLMGEFAPNPDGENVDILWREIVVVD